MSQGNTLGCYQGSCFQVPTSRAVIKSNAASNMWATAINPLGRFATESRVAHAQEGVVSSGNSLDYCQQDMDQMLASRAAIKEMEAAGIAWAAALHGTPLLALKAVTDIVDGDRPAQEEFLENLASAAKALQVHPVYALCHMGYKANRKKTIHAGGGLGRTWSLPLHVHAFLLLFSGINHFRCFPLRFKTGILGCRCATWICRAWLAPFQLEVN